jgi:uroporphyrin-III C-methyltransferase/precorrin-2 dehydrogenase/sirohydrochlorin ferrochelatase
MDYFPVFVKLKNQKCLVIGAGEIAARKIDLLARAGANITVIANKISHHVSNIEHSCHLTVLKKPFTKTDVRGFKLVISATDNK